MMNSKKYLEIFTHAFQYLDSNRLQQMQLQVAVGEILDSVYLKIFKTSWCHPAEDPLTARTRIFFSVWLNDEALSGQKLFYNIHAFKLRELPGHKIESRKFAVLFRKNFGPYTSSWKNVSVAFGPLTLMEGWVPIDPGHFQHEVAGLANKFLEIAPLIDDTLGAFKK